MWYLKFVALVYWLFGFLPFAEAVPGLSTIQGAYEREASSQSKLHDPGLKVLESKCHAGAGGPFLCEVKFVSVTDPSERLYFDIVTVARTAEGWELKSGLCKR